MNCAVAAVDPLIALFSSFFGVSAPPNGAPSTEPNPDAAATPKNSFSGSFIDGSRWQSFGGGGRTGGLSPVPMRGCAFDDRRHVGAQQQAACHQRAGGRVDSGQVIVAVSIPFVDRAPVVATRVTLASGGRKRDVGTGQPHETLRAADRRI